MSETVAVAAPGDERVVGRAQGLMLGAIRWYQRGVEGRPSPCRFFPSCSEYGHEAIEVHGAWRGGWLTARRLLRCRPFGPSGFDPVPLPHGEHVHHGAATHDPQLVDVPPVDPHLAEDAR